MNERVRRLRKAFRYLKRGVFPPDSIDQFTFGRAPEIAGINRRLDEVQQGSSRHVFVEGAYGRGKSHMLKAIEACALRRGFAVSWVILDGQHHACNHPTRYLHALLGSLRVSDSPCRGLAALIRSWLREGKAEQVVSWARQSTSWLGYAIPAYASEVDSLALAPHLVTWIESRDIANKNGRVWFDSISQRMQATAGLVRAAGYSGVVYLFDELETVATLLSSVRQRFLSYEFLNLLIDARRHSHCFFAFAGTPDFGARLDSDKGHRQFYADDYPDACRFVQKWLESSVDLIQLRRLHRADLLVLCKCLCGWHQEAYGWKASGRLRNEALEAFVEEAQGLSLGTREVIKHVVHCLELAEQHPTAGIEELLRLTSK